MTHRVSGVCPPASFLSVSCLASPALGPEVVTLTPGSKCLSEQLEPRMSPGFWLTVQGSSLWLWWPLRSLLVSWAVFVTPGQWLSTEVIVPPGACGHVW